MLWFQLFACRLLSSTPSRTHTYTGTHWHRKRKSKWLLSDKLFSNFGWMLICVNGINLHKSINCLFALPLVWTPVPFPCTHLSLILVLARPVHLGAPPLCENLQIGQKKEKQASGKLKSHLRTHRQRSHMKNVKRRRRHHLRKSEMTSSFFSFLSLSLSFSLLCFISLRVAARALATPWRLNVIFYSYLFIKARKAAHRLNCDRPHSRPCHASPSPHSTLSTHST